ncbi:MAG: HEAT repeat domain-containing protein, partial [Planctomycetota bacterium]
AESLDGFRTYQTQMRAAMYGMVMPALKSNTDYAKHISRFSNKWLALERKHGAASLLDVHLKGDSSEAALNELTAAMRTMLGPDVEIVAERIERTNSVVLVAAPSLRVEDINPPEIAGEQVSLPHLNVLMIKRNGGQGPPAADQLAQPAISAPADPMSAFAESPEAMSARLEAQATQTHNRMLNSNQSVSINFITPHPKGDQGNDWFSPIVDAVRDLLPDGNSGSSFRGAGDGTSSGTIYPVPDFDAFCDALNDHPYFTIEQSDPQTRAISLIVDWSAVKPGRYRDFDSDDWDDDFDDDDFDAEDGRAFGGGGVDGNMGRMASERLPQRGDPDYESKLTELMTTGNTFERDDAAKALLVAEKDGLDKAVRGKVAKAFLQFFRDRDHSNETVAIRGLVKFGGKHATKYLVESIHESDRDVHTLIYQALAKYPTAEGADAVASRLGERRESGLAAETLIKMGAIAEPSAIKALRTSDEDIALAAIYVLEHVGTEEAMSVLSVARDAGNPEVKEAAVKARTAIRKRRKS